MESLYGRCIDNDWNLYGRYVNNDAVNVIIIFINMFIVRAFITVLFLPL